MVKRLRTYVMPIVVTIALFALGAAAFAVVGGVSSNVADQNVGDNHDSDDVNEADDGHEITETAEVESDSESASTDENHGHCVSYWAHASKDAGLEGSDRGHFISTVAQDDQAVSTKVQEGSTPTGACGEYQSELDEAVSSQNANQDQTTDDEDNGSNHGKGKDKGEGNSRSGSDD